MSEGIIMVEKLKPLTNGNDETRTTAKVYKEDLETFKTIARIKFKKDFVNNGWKEATKLFIIENKHILKDKINEIPDKKK